MILEGDHAVLNTSTGVKWFKEQWVAERSYIVQKEAYEIGIAPPVFERIDNHSYRTGIASPLCCELGIDGNINAFQDLYDKIDKLFKKHGIKKVKNDFKTSNLGVWDNRIVFVDFS